jgi:phosphoenolpyruvate carboxykinase (ATP)
MPAICLGVPEQILDPRSTWADKDAYDEMANHLAREFSGNFEKYAGSCDPQVVNAGPTISIAV